MIQRPVVLALYRIAQESLRNVTRHSGSTAVSVVLAGTGRELSLSIIDNGKGFDLGIAKTGPGLGLVSLEERARQVAASVTIDSIPDAGTTLRVQVTLK
jgi:signal transduction histidine kinase